MTLGVAASSLIKTALERGRELEVLKEEPQEFHRASELKYVISQENKKYLVVHPDVHAAVVRYAKKKKLKMTEATWRLIGIGMKLEYWGEDPRAKKLLGLSDRLKETRSQNQDKETE